MKKNKICSRSERSVNSGDAALCTYCCRQRTTQKPIWVVLFVVSCLSVSCKKWIAVAPPVTFTSGDNVFKTNESAISAVTGLYVLMAANSDFFGSIDGANGLTFTCGLSADELNLDNSVVFPDIRSLYFTNSLDALHSRSNSIYWSDFYQNIYKCNAAIQQLADNTYLTRSVDEQLLGEVYFVRALNYFYLLNLYGDVPLILDTDYEKNRLVSRTDQAKVWEQIKDDLKKAQLLLSDSYLDNTLLAPTIERIRPTKAAATALLSRAYLYTKDWTNAEMEATKIIDNTTLYGLDTLNGVFLKNSNEAIWQLQPVDLGFNTREAVAFTIPPTGPDYLHIFTVNDALISNFEAGDRRKTSWIDSIAVSGVAYYFPYKYKMSTYGSPVEEYQMILRLGEQYLIRAEAHAQLGVLDDAIKDLDVIRKRAGLSLIQLTDPGITKEQLLDTIMHERQVELFAELGHRWFDLKRTAKVDQVMSTVTPIKANGNAWQSYQQWHPIPIDEIEKDPNLKQTDGY
jgi:hypothetical protein